MPRSPAPELPAPNGALGSYTTTYHPQDPHHPDLASILVNEPNGRFVALICWSPVSGTIDWVLVRDDLRRHGIATALWHQARQRCAYLRHDDRDELTDDGVHWARYVGGPNTPA
jgi:GNAT superfamily N-acetyltransferase